MTTPPSTPAGNDPPTWREHLEARVSAERRRSSAQREFNRLQRQLRRDLRGARRRGKTAAIAARATVAEIGVRGVARIVAAFRGRRDDS
jgi:hypothetical protein